uniref:Inositol polyphosphate-4-phosphatase type II B n=1 Tax=Callithrix jacchus TaxID=9483 RepID=A0A2R8MJA9_CALJA
MEIKEEGASEEGQHFLPTAQADDSGDSQFTSIQKTPNEPQLEFILVLNQELRD